ncbi:MAG: carbohydrate ABC transporter permease [Deltaproteobacteria bacterium]|nr:carbohydrate ABC transporter permease [Deltaproteobacteria bacterium]
MRRGWRKLGWAAAGLGLIIFSLTPFLWFVLTSLKTQVEVTAIPPTLWPAGSLGFYRSALENYGLLDFLRNSAIVAGGSTLLCLGLAVPAAFALARLRLPYKGLILGALLLVSMFPQISLAGPVWRILRAVGWLNTYQGLILPYTTFTLPLGVWVLTSFFRELPFELEEAALTDGCTRFQALSKVMLPLAAPGVFTAAILVFIYAWNEFFFALLIMTQRNVQTLPVGIALFQGEFTMPWGEIAAASTVAVLPLVVVVFLFQRRIVRGLAAGALKG